jgi:Mrp family chromosome partitioning ATPase
VLAQVPKLDAKEQSSFSVLAYDAPLSGATEAFRAVRSALLFQHGIGAAVAATDRDDAANAGRGTPGFDSDQTAPIVVMVASASPEEGKTTTTANLAAVFAEADASVLVVNCDFRRPMVHRYLGVPDTPRRVIDTRIPGVKAVTNVLAEPDANPARVLAEQRRLVSTARSQFDVMILDTAPLLSANDAIDLSGVADLVLLVAKADESLTTDAARAVEMLERVHAPVAGVVLIGGGETPNYYYAGYRNDAQVSNNGDKPAKVSRRQRRAQAKVAAASTNGHRPDADVPATPGAAVGDPPNA